MIEVAIDLPVASFGETGTQFCAANASFVTTQLAVGGDLSANYAVARRQLDELVAAGITHIVDLRAEWTDEQLVTGWEPGIHYFHHPVEDAGQVIGADWFNALLDWVRPALADPRTKLLVHCHMGVNRAPSAALAILLDAGWRLVDALDAIRDARPVAAIDYASCVLNWYFASTHADLDSRRSNRRSLGQWRQSVQLDVDAVIRTMRAAETGGNCWAIALARPDVDTLRTVFSRSGDDVAIGLRLDFTPPELCQLDQVLFVTCDGLVGRALVVGPVQLGQAGHRLLPLMIGDLFDPLPVGIPGSVADWLDQGGPNPRRLTGAEFTYLTCRAVSGLPPAA